MGVQVFLGVWGLVALVFTSFSYAQFEGVILPDQPVMAKEQFLPDRTLGISQRGDLILRSERPGDPLILKEKRSVRLLHEQDLANYYITPEALSKLYGNRDPKAYYIFGNYIHGAKDQQNARFWIVIIPKWALVDDIILQAEWFVEGAGAHFQLRYKLNLPMTLLPQGRRPDPEWYQKVADLSQLSQSITLAFNQPIQISSDFVFTLLAIRSEHGPQTWDPARGLTGSYANAYSIQSTAHAAKEQINTNYVEQFRLVHLQPRVAESMLAQTIAYADSAQEQHIYNTIFNSCITTVMESLSGYTSGVGLPIDPQDFNPYSAIKKFRDANLIEEIPSLNGEFNGRITRSDINARVKDKVDAMMPLITSEKFDLLIRDFAAYIVQHQWRYDELVAVYGALKSVPPNSNLEATYRAIESNLSNSGLSDERKAEIRGLTLRIAQFIVSRWGQFDPTPILVLENLGRQN